ncbi:hypothetical protein UFOVP823_29 [uncultured Caudovirales phage]|uniref:Uncharacterized protein n=1 Tax=uncultured Caudovirales phage TaxID=2100421 RepID=A0A6J5P2I6_9CAUD|nr:hypothetical protein UFOVP823_29 [uncultured Caudovirales phage]
MSDVRPKHALLDALSTADFSDAVVDVSGSPVAIFGVTTFTLAGHAQGLPWLVGTDAIKTQAKAFLRISPRIMRRFETSAHPLLGFVHAANITHIRWIAWVGFTLADTPEFIGPAGSPFIRFWRH